MNEPITLESHISEHAKWLFNHIYKNPYPYFYSKHKTSIARYFHGIEHVSRAALYTPIFLNLYRKYGDEEALVLNEEDLKLLQIAVLFHDAAREGEGEDLWDNESGYFLYVYLTKTLGVAEERAEAIANKDIRREGYYSLRRNDQNELKWVLLRQSMDSVISDDLNYKNIYQKLIHDADCLDIIRARDKYDARFLDFYKKFGQNNTQAFDMMAQLIVEARGLIYAQGDDRQVPKPKVKENYECANAYHKIERDIYKTQYNCVLLRTLYNGGKLASQVELQAINGTNFKSYDPTAPFTGDNAVAALNEGKVLARGVTIPSGEVNYTSPTKPKETSAALEIRKTLRRLGQSTRTHKANNLEKQGNLKRSTSVIGHGAGVYSTTGFLITNPDFNSIVLILERDIDSGFGKKKGDHHLRKQNYSQADLDKVVQILKLGGVISCQTLNHTEILYNITEFNAIYYTKDPVSFNKLCGKRYGESKPSREAYHQNAPLLQAIFLQNEYRKALKIKLPIFEYSGLHNRFHEITELSDKDILDLWVNTCGDFIENCIDMKDLSVLNMDIDAIKMYSVYGSKGNIVFSAFSPALIIKSADSNYDEDLQDQINAAIFLRRQKIIEYKSHDVMIKIASGKFALTNDHDFLGLYLNPSLAQQVNDSYTIIQQLKLANLDLDKELKLLSMSIKTFRKLKLNHSYIESHTFRVIFTARALGQHEIVEQFMQECARQFISIIKNAKDPIEALGDLLPEFIPFVMTFKLEKLMDQLMPLIQELCSLAIYNNAPGVEKVVKSLSINGLVPELLKNIVYSALETIASNKELNKLSFLIRAAKLIHVPEEKIKDWLKSCFINKRINYAALEISTMLELPDCLEFYAKDISVLKPFLENILDYKSIHCMLMKDDPQFSMINFFQYYINQIKSLRLRENLSDEINNIINKTLAEFDNAHFLFEPDLWWEYIKLAKEMNMYKITIPQFLTTHVYEGLLNFSGNVTPFQEREIEELTQLYGKTTSTLMP